jgi:tungsten cofactor oxidoreducase radical SAM maturase
MHIFNFEDAEIRIPERADMNYLFLEITNRYNLKCEMCFKQYWDDEEGDMPYTLFSKILKDAKEFPNLKMIYFGGIGEPTVHPELMHMVEDVKNSGYAVGISTNGFLLTQERMEKLVDLGVDLLYISLDSIPVQPTDIGHIMPGVTVDRLEKLSKLKKERDTELPHIGVEVVVTKENYKLMGKIADYLAKYEINSLLLSNLMPITQEHAKQIVYDGSVDIEPYLNELYKHSYSGFLLRVPEFKLRTERRCDFVENKVAVIRWDGEVAPCYRFLHTYPEYVLGREKKVYAHSSGNVKERSLKEIWNSREYTWFRFAVKNALFPSCTDCSLADSCSFVKDTKTDCWANEPSCGDCLWWRKIIQCPIPIEMNGKFW